MGTVIGVLILFIPLCALCRHLDKKDNIKVRTIQQLQLPVAVLRLTVSFLVAKQFASKATLMTRKHTCILSTHAHKYTFGEVVSSIM